MSETPISLKRSRYFTSLKLKNRIDHLFKNGRKVFGQHLMLRFDRNTEKTPPFHVVFAVSGRLGTAVVRNRIKRRLREALLLVLKEQAAPARSIDLAIVPRKEVAAMDFAKLCADLKGALRRLPR